MKSVFDFSRTEIIVKLASKFSNVLMSRSLGKQAVSGIEKFKEVVLDYEGIEEIGQGFADEIYRIFTKTHPDASLFNANCISYVSFMIGRGKKSD